MSIHKIITDQAIFNFYLAYIDSVYSDPHDVFAELQRIPRNEAKELCYKIAYTYWDSPIFDAYRENVYIALQKDKK